MVIVVKNPSAKAGDGGDADWIPGWERSPGGGHGNPLQFSCLENSMDRGDQQVQSIGLHRVGHDSSDLAHTHKRSKAPFFHFIFPPDPVFNVHTKKDL